ncbi:MAG: 4-(cytidine 5'-diphospho)-2-C-methyl-D-erythritol kinase [Chloroflexi bacterium]|nr:4-(cytidine 5'-diphospho)-2-C-methyl-D-erythritol kinase [Chloroflexota bacterium]
MRLRAPAKVNLGLELTAKRPDGYHEVSSVMMAVQLCDEVETFRTETGSSHVDDLPREFIRTELTDTTLALFAAATEGDSRFETRIAKHIPVAAGLGGGSSDAAIALAAANWLSQNPLSDLDLVEIAGRIGSDVTFFLSGGCARVSGRGEIVQQALPMPEVWIVLANPGFELSTPDVYRELKRSDLTDGKRTGQIAESIAGGAPNWELMYNGLQAAALRLCPQIQTTLDLIARHTPFNLLSGSGPTCFGLFETREPAAAAERELIDAGHWTWLGRPQGPWHVSDLRID